MSDLNMSALRSLEKAKAHVIYIQNDLSLLAIESEKSNNLQRHLQAICFTQGFALMVLSSPFCCSAKTIMGI